MTPEDVLDAAVFRRLTVQEHAVLARELGYLRSEVERYRIAVSSLATLRLPITRL